MLHVLIGTDRPVAGARRRESRGRHLAYSRDTGAVVAAGPFPDGGGGRAGSLVVLDVGTRQSEDWAAGDPHAAAGLFEAVESRAWRKVIG